MLAVKGRIGYIGSIRSLLWCAGIVPGLSLYTKTKKEKNNERTDSSKKSFQNLFTFRKTAKD